MHSINGRIKGNKAEASNKDKEGMILVCKRCQGRVVKKSKEFGEEIICDNCGSHDLEYVLE